MSFADGVMVRNNFTKDFSELCLIKNVTKASVAVGVGVKPPAIPRDLKLTIINKKFVEYCEYLGYDIEVTYVER